jgi:hypothetical protein
VCSLTVLLAQVEVVRLDDVEELADDCRDAHEESWPHTPCVMRHVPRTVYIY